MFERYEILPLDWIPNSPTNAVMSTDEARACELAARNHRNTITYLRNPRRLLRVCSEIAERAGENFIELGIAFEECAYRSLRP